jgi:hypothetical protein
MFSRLAEAKVARKYSPGSGLSFSVKNHEPLATRTPLLMHELKISSSMSSSVREPAAGCFS